MPLTRICTLSGKEFEITDDDLHFYEKISPILGGKKYLIPPPTLCPEERMRRRLSWRNMHSLYKTKCAITQKDIISLYSPNRPYRSVDQAIWWGDTIDSSDYKRDYDPSGKFYTELDALMRSMPLFCLSNEYRTNENAEYVQGTNNVKNSYLVFNAMATNNCEYSDSIYHAEDCFDDYFCRESQDCYDCISMLRCQSCISLEESEDCARVDFSYNCKGCQDCLLSYGLTNQQYMIANVQYTKTTYEEAKKKYIKNNDSYDYIALSRIFANMKSMNPIEKTIIYNSENVSGNHISNCFNVQGSYDTSDSKNCKYIATFSKAEDCYDCFSWWYMAENCYECVAVGNSVSGLMGCYAVWWGSARVYYSYSCLDCQDCFGCVGLRDKKYCILNKQYTKEEYEVLARKIIEDMIHDGEWGEYLAPSISPFGYNETMANLYFPLSREEALAKWYQWNDYEAPRPEAEKYIPASKLPDDITKIPDDILNWAIECSVSGKYYKITRPELEFYRKHMLSIPTKHPDIRRKERFDRRV